MSTSSRNPLTLIDVFAKKNPGNYCGTPLLETPLFAIPPNVRSSPVEVSIHLLTAYFGSQDAKLRNSELRVRRDSGDATMLLNKWPKNAVHPAPNFRDKDSTRVSMWMPRKGILG